MTQSNRVFDYVAEAQQTKSTSFHGGKLSRRAVLSAVSTAIHALEQLDKVKKALFYGKIVPEVAAGNLEASALTLSYHNVSTDIQTAYDIVHGIIGKATEAGELLEALKLALVNDVLLDRVNVIEETGDGFWYDAILMDALQFNFGQAQAVNIAKLRARYPERFTEYDAQNRDLNAERKILENGA